MQSVQNIVTLIYSSIGMIGGLYSLVKYHKEILKEHNEKQKEEDKISFQIAMINKTLIEHETKEEETKKFISDIEKEQEQQNLTISELHTKLDMLCKSAKSEKEEKKE